MLVSDLCLTFANSLFVSFTLHSFATAHTSQSEYRLLRLIIDTSRQKTFHAVEHVKARAPPG